MRSTLWSNKCQSTFADVEDMKQFIADRLTAFRRFAGKDVYYAPSDVILLGDRILLDGLMVGYCGD
jgi:hypothetical protein